MVQWYTTFQNLFVSLNEFKILYQNKKTIIIGYVIYKLQVYYHSFISWYTARLQIAENPALLPPHWIAYKSQFKRFVTHTLPRQYVRLLWQNWSHYIKVYNPVSYFNSYTTRILLEAGVSS